MEMKVNVKRVLVDKLLMLTWEADRVLTVHKRQEISRKQYKQNVKQFSKLSDEAFIVACELEKATGIDCIFLKTLANELVEQNQTDEVCYEILSLLGVGVTE